MTTFLPSPGLAINEASPFPDGQPHIAFTQIPDGYGFGNTISLRCRIVSPLDLMNVACAVEVLTERHWRVALSVYYLTGGRMDRRLSAAEPFTLRAVCRILNSFNLASISVFCQHSDVTTTELANHCSIPGDESHFFDVGIQRCLTGMVPCLKPYHCEIPNVAKPMSRVMPMSLVFPDKGASKRFGESAFVAKFRGANIVTLEKDRDERTGRINGIKILSGEPRQHCVIVDDLCDGGATFKGAAVALRGAGAETVGLVVAHGVFSRGTAIKGVDFISTTNSFIDRSSSPSLYVFNL